MRPTWVLEPGSSPAQWIQNGSCWSRDLRVPRFLSHGSPVGWGAPLEQALLPCPCRDPAKGQCYTKARIQANHSTRDSRSVLRLTEPDCEAALCAGQSRERRRTEIQCTHISRDEFCVFLACDCIHHCDLPSIVSTVANRPHNHDNQPDKKPVTGADNCIHTYISIPCDYYCPETWFFG